jgi:hypothetical protein
VVALNTCIELDSTVVESCKGNARNPEARCAEESVVTASLCAYAELAEYFSATANPINASRVTTQAIRNRRTKLSLYSTL